MDSTPIFGLGIPSEDGSDGADLAALLRTLGLDVEGKAGGITAMTNAARVALSGAGKYEGRVVYETDTDLLWISDGTNWRQITLGTQPYAIGTATSTAQSCTVGGTVITYDGETDPFAMLNTGTGTITLPSAGVWQVNASLFLQTNATDSLIMLLHNAAQVGLQPIVSLATTSALIVAAANDTVKLQFVNSSSGSKTVESARLSVAKIGT